MTGGAAEPGIGADVLVLYRSSLPDIAASLRASFRACTARCASAECHLQSHRLRPVHTRHHTAFAPLSAAAVDVLTALAPHMLRARNLHWAGLQPPPHTLASSTTVPHSSDVFAPAAHVPDVGIEPARAPGDMTLHVSDRCGSMCGDMCAGGAGRGGHRQRERAGGACVGGRAVRRRGRRHAGCTQYVHRHQHIARAASQYIVCNMTQPNSNPHPVMGETTSVRRGIAGLQTPADNRTAAGVSGGAMGVSGGAWPVVASHMVELPTVPCVLQSHARQPRMDMCQ